jgi:hypothetical protein
MTYRIQKKQYSKRKVFYEIDKWKRDWAGDNINSDTTKILKKRFK